MRRRGTMLQLSNGSRATAWILLLISLIALGCGIAAAQNSTGSSAQPSGQSRTNPPAQDDILLPQEGVSPEKVPAATTPEPTVAPTPAPANQPNNTVNVPRQAQPGREAEKNSSGQFVFKSDVQEVTLHATVVDDRQ